MRPCILLAFALLAFSGCTLAELGSAPEPAWEITEPENDADASAVVTIQSDLQSLKREVEVLRLGQHQIRTELALRPFREEKPVEKLTAPRTQPSAKYDASDSYQPSGRLFGGRVLGGRCFGGRCR